METAWSTRFRPWQVVRHTLSRPRVWQRAAAVLSEASFIPRNLCLPPHFGLQVRVMDQWDDRSTRPAPAGSLLQAHAHEQLQWFPPRVMSPSWLASHILPLDAIELVTVPLAVEECLMEPMKRDVKESAAPSLPKVYGTGKSGGASQLRDMLHVQRREFARQGELVSGWCWRPCPSTPCTPEPCFQRSSTHHSHRDNGDFMVYSQIRCLTRKSELGALMACRS